MRERIAQLKSAIKNCLVPAIPMAALMGAVIGGLYYDDHSLSPLVATTAVGKAMEATYHPSAYGESRTSVKATGAILSVIGTFQVIKGNELVVEARKDGSRKLCDHSQGACKTLI